MKYFTKKHLFGIFIAAIATAAYFVATTPTSKPEAHLSKPLSAILSQQIHKAGVSSSWFDGAAANIKTHSYDFSGQKGSFVANNFANNLLFHIDNKGFKVSSMASGNWDASLSLSGVFSDGKALSTGKVMHTDISENTLLVNYDKFSIEYINSKSGLRQNFIVNSLPKPSNEVILTLAIDSKQATPIVEDNTLSLLVNKQKVYTYSDLKVFDKNGESLKADMKLTDNNELALIVDVTNAAFPITIDPLSAVPPLSTSYAWMDEGDNFNCGYGFWLTGLGDVNGDGYADVAIGAPEYTLGLAQQGCVFVYYGSASGLPTSPSWTYLGDKATGSMGKCISGGGDFNADGYDDMIVGAHQYANPQPDEGKAFVFYGSASGFGSTPGWTFECNKKNAKLGEAVTNAGDLNGDGYDDACVGAHAYDVGGLDKAGKFWVFLGGPTGLSTTYAMTHDGTVEDQEIGISMDAGGDINGDGFGDLIVGGYIFLIGDGMCCIYQGEEDGIEDEVYALVIGGAHDTSFYAVNLSTAADINGDGYSDVIVGMPRFDYLGIYNAGKLRYYYGSPSGLDTLPHEMYGDAQYDERWAFNVNDAGDLNDDGYADILVGAKYFNAPGAAHAGKAELFLGGPNGPSATPTWTFVGDRDSANIGSNLANVGDVNGDGHEDVIVTGTSFSDDVPREGVAYLFYGQDQVCDAPTGFAISSITPTTAYASWQYLYGASSYKVTVRKIGAAGSTNYNTTNIYKTITGLTPSSTYKIYVRALCQAGYSVKSVTLTIHTPAMREGNFVQDVNIYPNPVKNQLNIYAGSMTGITTVKIVNIAGQQVYEKVYNLTSEQSTISINEVADWNAGNYITILENNGQRAVEKFVKIY